MAKGTTKVGFEEKLPFSMECICMPLSRRSFITGIHFIVFGDKDGFDGA